MTFAFILAENPEQQKAFVEEFKKVVGDDVIYVDHIPKEEKMSAEVRAAFYKLINVKEKTVLFTEFNSHEYSVIVDKFQGFDHGEPILYCLDKKLLEDHKEFYTVIVNEESSIKQFVRFLT